MFTTSIITLATLFGLATPTSKPTTAIPSNMAQVNVYATSHGTKYHTHKDCQYLKHSSEVKTITLEQAQKDGKTLCKKCSAKAEKANKK